MTTNFPTAPPAYGLEGPSADSTVEKSLSASHTEILTLPFVRLANPKARREAITSRQWLLSSIGRATSHAGQTTITITGQHAYFHAAREALMRVSSLLHAWGIKAAEQLHL